MEKILPKIIAIVILVFLPTVCDIFSMKVALRFCYLWYSHRPSKFHQRLARRRLISPGDQRASNIGQRAGGNDAIHQLFILLSVADLAACHSLKVPVNAVRISEACPL